MRKGSASVAFSVMVAIGAISAVLVWDGRLASRKPLWSDEGMELTLTCASDAGQMLARGAPAQGSGSPLYYILLRGLVRGLPSLGSELRGDSETLTKLRMISLLAASGVLTATVSTLFSWAGPAVGPIVATVAFFAVNSQPIFHSYAAENRPYMFWMLSFALLVFLVARLGAKPYSAVSRAEKAALAAIGVALALTAVPGMVQFDAACAGLAWRWRGPGRRATLRLARFLVPLVAAVTAIGLYYTQHSFKLVSGGEFDLLETRNLELVWTVTDLVFPRSLRGLPVTGLAALGLALPFVAGGRRKAPTALAALRFGVVTQLAVAAVLAALVAFQHYYFIQRVFLYLILCRALLAACGAWFLLEWFVVGRKARERAALAGAAARGVFSLARLPALIESRAPSRPGAGAASSLDCARIGGKLRLFDTEQSRRLMALPVNTLAEVGARRRECAARGELRDPGPAQALIAADSASYRLLEAPPAGSQPMQACGRPLEFEKAF